MATTRIMAIHSSVRNTIEYVKNDIKTENGQYISSYACTPDRADEEFELSKSMYRYQTGRVHEHDVTAYQVRQSFKPGEVTAEEANRIGYEFAERFLKGNHAFIVCTHTDKQHIHNHIVWNSVTLDCRRKFRNFIKSGKAVAELSDQICIEHELSVITNPKPHGITYDKWLGDKKQPSYRAEVRLAIDKILLQTPPQSFDEFAEKLSEMGYTVTTDNKVILTEKVADENTSRDDERTFTRDATEPEQSHTFERDNEHGDEQPSELHEAPRASHDDKNIADRKSSHDDNDYKLAPPVVEIALDSLGEGYTEADIIKVINGECVHVSFAPYDESSEKETALKHGSSRITNRDIVRSDIDGILKTQPKDFDEFLTSMATIGYTVQHGKHLTLNHAKFKRTIRMDSLGDGYTEADIKAIIAGERKQPRTANDVPDTSSHKDTDTKQPKTNETKARKDVARAAIDNILKQKPKDFTEFLQLLGKSGYVVNIKRHTTLSGKEIKIPIRMDLLGDGYTEADIRAVISGERKHTPKKTIHTQDRTTLLIDIEAKIREGKGETYTKWATTYNVKQMAKTVNFLRENKLLDYGELTKRIESSSQRMNEIRDEMATAETLLSRNATLQMHITNYLKGRDIYKAYRMSGYSRVYLKEHGETIAKVQDAKKYFDSIGKTKLPSLQTLKAEYSEVLTKKKTCYAKLRELKNQHRELLIHKENIDVILGIAETKKSKKHEHER